MYKKEGYCTILLDAFDPDYQGIFGLLLHSSTGKTMKFRAFSREFLAFLFSMAKLMEAYRNQGKIKLLRIQIL